MTAQYEHKNTTDSRREQKENNVEQRARKNFMLVLNSPINAP